MQLLNAAFKRIGDACVYARARARSFTGIIAPRTYGRINRGLSNESFAYYPALDRNARFR